MSASVSASSTTSKRFDGNLADLPRHLQDVRAALSAIRKNDNGKHNGRSLVEEYTIPARGVIAAVHIDRWECPIIAPEPVRGGSSEADFKKKHETWKMENMRYIRERDSWVEADRLATELIRDRMSDAASLAIGADFLGAKDLWERYLEFYDIPALSTARLAEVGRLAKNPMLESEGFLTYYSRVMPYIIEHYNCPESAHQARDQLLANVAGIKRLRSQVDHCRLSDSTTLQCKNLLAIADVRQPLSKGGAFVGMMTDDSEPALPESVIAALSLDDFKCWNCGEDHKGDCPKPCRYCMTLGRRGMENSKNHELMDCIKFRISRVRRRLSPIIWASARLPQKSPRKLAGTLVRSPRRRRRAARKTATRRTVSPTRSSGP